MDRQYSIAEARDHLPGLVRQVERGGPVELTRRGKPVAVLVSIEEYRRLAANRPSKTFMEAVEGFRRAPDFEPIDVDAVFRDVRDQSPGRPPVEW